MSYIVQLRARPGDESYTGNPTRKKKKRAGTLVERQVAKDRQDWMQTLWADVDVPNRIDDKFRDIGTRDASTAEWLVEIPGLKAGDVVRVISGVGDRFGTSYFTIEATPPQIRAVVAVDHLDATIEGDGYDEAEDALYD